MQTTVNVYRFDISKPEEKKQYLELCKTLENKGLKKFAYSNPEKFDVRQNFLNKLREIKTFEIDTNFIHENQFNTKPLEGEKKGFHLMDWSEPIFPNKDIKEGYYCELPPEIWEFRKNVHICQYCGQMYHKPENLKDGFCVSCIGSEYLKKSDLHLLRVQPILGKKHVVNVPKWFIDLYDTEQKKARLKKLEKEQKNKLADLQKNIAAAEIEYNLFKLLISKGVNYKAAIYYKHSNTLNFNWSSEQITETEYTQFIEGLTDAEKKQLPDGLTIELNKGKSIKFINP